MTYEQVFKKRLLDMEMIRDVHSYKAYKIKRIRNGQGFLQYIELGNSSESRWFVRSYINGMIIVCNTGFGHRYAFEHIVDKCAVRIRSIQDKEHRSIAEWKRNVAIDGIEPEGKSFFDHMLTKYGR